MNIENKVVVITGATSGIGATTAKKFAEHGAKVVVAGRRKDRGNEVVSEIVRKGGRAIFLESDVTDSKSIQKLITDSVSKYGRIDFAFNNAGTGGNISPLHEQDENDWQSVLDINLKGVWLSLKYQITQMLKQGGGNYSIVNMSSLWGTGASDIGASPYIASKHGVIGLTKAASLEYAGAGIRVNAICPAWVPTEANAAVLSNPEINKHVASQHPIGRLGTQEEIAEAVIWLCSQGAGFITGQAILADGGISARR
jgi:NAD(P)-dependent dehydrogenase (short-subunit alcohol dehydrogenase family)